MRLKSLDKYIKDKAQSYKPPYQEDLWKDIEKKLPVARVPNGYGSWMLPVAAVIVAAVVVPFTIKFYNITGRSQEMALKNIENKSQNNTIPYRNNITTTSPAVSAISPTVSSSANAPAISTDKLADGNNHSPAIAVAAEKTTRSARALSPRVRGNNGRHSGIDAPQSSGQNIASSSASDKLVALNAVTESPLTDYISPENAPIENMGSQDISTKVKMRYPDHTINKDHPINNSHWENWQSIFYPFWLNPAYTGSEGTLNLTSDYKFDHIAEPNSVSTQSNFAADLGIRSIGLGVGVFCLNTPSSYSIQNTYGLALSQALIRKGATTLKIGVSGTMINNRLYFNSLNYSDQINPLFGFIHATNDKNVGETTQTFGINGGLWLNSPHLMLGADVTNYNQPKPGFISEAAPLPREWRATLGYRFALCNDLQLMPMVIVTRENLVNQANDMLTIVYKDNYMLTLAYQNINPTSGWGNPFVYGAVNVVKRVRVFASYGKDIELQQMGVNETFFHLGLKWVAIR